MMALIISTFRHNQRKVIISVVSNMQLHQLLEDNLFIILFYTSIFHVSGKSSPSDTNPFEFIEKTFCGRDATAKKYLM